MKILIGVIAFALVSLSISAKGQTGPSSNLPVAAKPAASTQPLDVAKAALAAHGGDKLKKMRSLVMKGSVEMNVMGQTMPGAFSTAFSGEKYFFEISSAVQQLKQVYDGRDTYSSIPGFSLPPVTTVGFPILARVGDVGYTVSALPETAKKKRGFRITAPDGFYTDFIIDEKTGLVKGYESAFEVGGRAVTTSADVDETLTIEGVIIPKKYSQRFDLGQLVAYASFKAKDILVNTTIEDSAFALPN